jgi:hypothetical protein
MNPKVDTVTESTAMLMLNERRDNRRLETSSGDQRPIVLLNSFHTIPSQPQNMVRSWFYAARPETGKSTSTNNQERGFNLAVRSAFPVTIFSDNITYSVDIDDRLVPGFCATITLSAVFLRAIGLYQFTGDI